MRIRHCITAHVVPGDQAVATRCARMLRDALASRPPSSSLFLGLARVSKRPGGNKIQYGDSERPHPALRAIRAGLGKSRWADKRESTKRREELGIRCNPGRCTGGRAPILFSSCHDKHVQQGRRRLPTPPAILAMRHHPFGVHFNPETSIPLIEPPPGLP